MKAFVLILALLAGASFGDGKLKSQITCEFVATTNIIYRF